MAYLTDPAALGYFGHWEAKYVCKYVVQGPWSLVNLVEKCYPWVISRSTINRLCIKQLFRIYRTFSFAQSQANITSISKQFTPSF